jgi:hypothetical protein
VRVGAGVRPESCCLGVWDSLVWNRRIESVSARTHDARSLARMHMYAHAFGRKEREEV